MSKSKEEQREELGDLVPTPKSSLLSKMLENEDRIKKFESSLSGKNVDIIISKEEDIVLFEIWHLKEAIGNNEKLSNRSAIFELVGTPVSPKLSLKRRACSSYEYEILRNKLYKSAFDSELVREALWV